MLYQSHYFPLLRAPLFSQRNIENRHDNDVIYRLQFQLFRYRYDPKNNDHGLPATMSCLLKPDNFPTIQSSPHPSDWWAHPGLINEVHQLKL